VVASKFFPIEGPDGKQHPLCERDYFRRLNLICAKCGMALRGSYITACSMSIYLLSSYGLSLTFSRQEVSRGALHLLDMPHTFWAARLILRTRRGRLLPLPLLDEVCDQVCRV